MSTKDWIEKDYYKVLGVSKDATLRRSRRLTASWRETTTDQNPGNCCRTALQGDLRSQRRAVGHGQAQGVRRSPPAVW